MSNTRSGRETFIIFFRFSYNLETHKGIFMIMVVVSSLRREIIERFLKFFSIKLLREYCSECRVCSTFFFPRRGEWAAKNLKDTRTIDPCAYYNNNQRYESSDIHRYTHVQRTWHNIVHEIRIITINRTVVYLLPIL